MQVRIAEVSLLHAAVVIIGILVMVCRVNATANGTLPSGMKAVDANGTLLTGMEAVHFICSKSSSKDLDLCINTLTPTARHNASATLNDFTRAAWEAIVTGKKAVKANGTLPTGMKAVDANHTLPTGMEAVHFLCSKSYFKDLCNNTLTPTARNNASATLKDFALAAFEALLNELKSGHNRIDSLRKTLKLPKNNFNMILLEECDEGDFQKPISWVEEAMSNITGSIDPTLSALSSHLLYTTFQVTNDQFGCDADLMYPDQLNPDVVSVLNDAVDKLDRQFRVLTDILRQLRKMSPDYSEDEDEHVVFNK